MNMRIDGSSSSIPTPTTPSFPDAGAVFVPLTYIQQTVNLLEPLPTTAQALATLTTGLNNIPTWCDQAMAAAGVTNYDPTNPPSDPVVNKLCEVLTSLSGASLHLASESTAIFNETASGITPNPEELELFNQAITEVSNDSKEARHIVNKATNG